jgi:hypothetical protein
MRLIGLWMTAVLLIAPFDTVAGEGTKGWYLIEPPVDETSKVLFGILNQAPLNQWKRVATYDSEAICEYKRNEAVQASRDETLRLSKTSPLPKLEIFKGAYRDSGLANASICVSADDPRLTAGSTR